METQKEDQDQKKIRVLVKRAYMSLLITKILYCEAEGDYTKIFMTDKTDHYFASGHLLEITRRIGCDRFHRIHDKYLANLRYYVRLNTYQGKRDLYIGAKTMLQVSARKLPGLNKKLKELGLKR